MKELCPLFSIWEMKNKPIKVTVLGFSTTLSKQNMIIVGTVGKPILSITPEELNEKFKRIDNET